MTALKIMLAGGVAAAALASAAPAAAQYYPGYGYPGYGSPYGGNVVGQVLNDVLGNGYGNYGGNSQAAVSQCVGAVQARLGGGYGAYGNYGNYGYANGRVLGVSGVEPRSNGGMTVRGVAASGRNGYGNQPDLTWKCKIDYRGMISDVDVDPAQGTYGYNYNGYPGYNGAPAYGAPGYNNYDYSQYGYRRY